MVGSVASNRDIPEAWFTLRVDENSDPTCDRVWQDEDLTVTSLEITPASDNDPIPVSTIVNDGRFVKIESLKSGTKYQVKIEYDTPLELKTVVEQPVIRLEIYRPPPVRRVLLRGATEENHQNADRED